MRSKVVPGIAFLLAAGAIAVTIVLQEQVTASRHAQLELASVKTELNRLQSLPFQAIEATGGSPEIAREQMVSSERGIRDTVSELQRDDAPAPLGSVPAALSRNYAILQRIYSIGVRTDDYGKSADLLARESGVEAGRVTALLNAASRDYATRASRDGTRAVVGGTAAILLLLAAFVFYYSRSLKTARENRRLLLASREEALRDSLTGLANRRALTKDLEAEIPLASKERPLVLILFDLDGFKHYNDSFGHPAGDDLLRRLGRRLASAAVGLGTAYRLGGDEFCLVARVQAGAAEEAATIGAAALTETGDGFEIGCSYGLVEMPADAVTASEGLKLADQRMYAQKAERSPDGRQSADALLELMGERSAGLGEHVSRVAGFAEQVARRLSLSESQVKQVRIAAELHDIGKSAIPDAILNKPGPLDDDEWKLMRRHTLIGERIILAVPTLREAAKLVRSSHEHVDGRGYPSGVKGGEIPLGSRIISVCDAFDAMTSDRPFRAAMSNAEALAELRRCAGSQFDPLVVDVLCALIEDSEPMDRSDEEDSVVAADSERDRAGRDEKHGSDPVPR